MTELDTPELVAQRRRLVERLRVDERITSPRVLEAFSRVPRHRFVAESQRAFAYADRALPISENQTISQPTMIALMLEALDCQPSDRVLEVGSGCGYAAALLAELTAEVHTVEIRPKLAESARENLSELGYAKVSVHVGDGRLGLPELAPFQRILVSAGASEIPARLLAQLALGGRIAIPLDGEHGQRLELGERRAEGATHWTHGVTCVFVPLIAANSSES